MQKAKEFLKAHKWAVAVAVGVAAAADHFFGTGIVSSTLADLMAQ
jgi:hypothetical protein